MNQKEAIRKMNKELTKAKKHFRKADSILEEYLNGLRGYHAPYSGSRVFEPIEDAIGWIHKNIGE